MTYLAVFLTIYAPTSSPPPFHNCMNTSIRLCLCPISMSLNSYLYTHIPSFPHWEFPSPCIGHALIPYLCLFFSSSRPHTLLKPFLQVVNISFFLNRSPFYPNYVSLALSTPRATTGFTAIAQDPTLKKEILTAILAIGKADGLKSFEQVRDIHLSDQLWTVDNDFLTPTFKTKRPALTKHFKDVIDQMYEKLD